MRFRAPSFVGFLLLPLAAPTHAAERVNVVADRVRGVATVDAAADAAPNLLVFVVDDAGDPIDEVQVSVLAAGKEVASGRTDSRGRVLLSVKARTLVSVRAQEAGFVPSLARAVTLRRGGLAAVALPLEEAPLPPPPPDEPSDAKPEAPPSSAPASPPSDRPRAASPAPVPESAKPAATKPEAPRR